MTLPSHPVGSVDTVLTLHSPHRPVILSHPSVHALYNRIAAVWAQARLNTSSRTPLFLFYTSLIEADLHDVTVASVAGGLRDTLIRSELCSLSELLPATHAVTAVSTQVPHVWAEIDHNAGMWCNQIVRVLARLLHDLVEPATKQPSLPPSQRIAVFREHLLSPLPALLDLTPPRHEHPMTPSSTPKTSATPMEGALRKTWTTPTEGEDFEWRIAEASGSFLAISTLSVTVNLCERHACVDATRNATAPVPLARSILRRFHSLTREAHVISVPASVLHSYATLRLTVAPPSSASHDGDFLIARFEGSQPISSSYSSLIRSEVNRTPSSAPLFTSVTHSLPASLVSVVTVPELYKFHNFRVHAKHACQGDNEKPLFSPVIGQFTPGFHEERYNAEELVIRYHELPDVHARTSPVAIMVMADPVCPIVLRMEVDWLHSLGTFARGFVHVLVAPSFAIALVAHSVQILCWRSSGDFPLMHSVLTELLYMATPLLAPMLLVALALEYLHLHLMWPLSFFELIDHSYTLMAPPWPSLLHLLVLHLLAFTGVWLWSAVCHVLLWIPARLFRCATQANKTCGHSCLFTYIHSIIALPRGVDRRSRPRCAWRLFFSTLAALSTFTWDSLWAPPCSSLFFLLAGVLTIRCALSHTAPSRPVLTTAGLVRLRPRPARALHQSTRLGGAGARHLPQRPAIHTSPVEFQHGNGSLHGRPCGLLRGAVPPLPQRGRRARLSAVSARN